MVEINNQTSETIDEAAFCRVAERILKQEGRQDSSFSLAFVGEEESRRLNREYRKKDKPANVLSFPESAFGLGEVILCPAQIRREANEYGIIYSMHLLRVFIHGILHLLGYDHEKGALETKLMEKKEESYITSLSPSF